LAGFFYRICDDDRMAAHSGYLGNAPPHGAGAENGDWGVFG
jgi:hypothetical protein